MRRPDALRRLLVWLLWLSLWAAAAAIIQKPLLLPSPKDTLFALFKLLPTGALWRAVLATLLRVSLGFFMGLSLGALLAVLICVSRWSYAFFSPMLSAVGATPVASFILLALVWIRLDGVPAFATALVVLPLAAANIAAGIRAVDPELDEMARAFGMKRSARLWYVYWPSVLPFLRAAIASGMGMAWKSGVAAEVIVTPRSALGSLLYSAKVYLDMPGLFATTAVVIALSIALEKALAQLMRGPKGGA